MSNLTNNPKSVTNYNASDVLKNGIPNFKKQYYSEYDRIGRSALLMLQLNKGGKLWMKAKTLKGCIAEAQNYLDNNKDQTGYLINNSKTIVIFMNDVQNDLIGTDGNVL
tara:strand:+ start:389 stop:715 length:327 start_codon:yes stop_codon:yes gene_type:complete